MNTELDQEDKVVSKRMDTYDTLPRALSEVSLRESGGSGTPPPNIRKIESPSIQRKSSLSSVREENEEEVSKEIEKNEVGMPTINR